MYLCSQYRGDQHQAHNYDSNDPISKAIIVVLIWQRVAADMKR